MMDSKLFSSLEHISRMVSCWLSYSTRQNNSCSWQNKALNVATQVGHGFAIANSIREALPIISGAARTAAGYLPALAAAGAPFGF